MVGADLRRFGSSWSAWNELLTSAPTHATIWRLPSKQSEVNMPDENERSDTENLHKLLGTWLDLNRVLHESNPGHPEVVPWDCEKTWWCRSFGINHRSRQFAHAGALVLLPDRRQ